MKTVTEQLQEMNLKFGDFCELEGIDGLCVVLQGAKGPYAISYADRSFAYNTHRVLRGWMRLTNRKESSWFNSAEITPWANYYRVDPREDKLPDEVEKAIDELCGTYDRVSSAKVRWKIMEIAKLSSRLAKETK